MTLSSEQQRWLTRAIECAREGIRQPGGGPFGAVIVKDGQLLAEAHNLVVASHDPTAHAEVLAIRAACRKLATHVLDGAQIYASCEPCPMCYAAIRWARLDCLFYAATRTDAAEIGFDDEALYAELAGNDTDVRQLPTKQALRDDARSAMAKWLDVSGDRHY